MLGRLGRSELPLLPANVAEFEKWVWLALQSQDFFRSRQMFDGPLVYYEFGTGGGKTLSAFLRIAKAYAKSRRIDLQRVQVCCFDTFSGLPEASHGADHHVRWSAGRFSRGREEIAELIRKEGFGPEQTELVEGRYEDTLTADLRSRLLERGLAPAIVTVDCDYYSSTKTVLDWLPPLLRSGTLFYFDDTLAFHGHPDMGQLRAIREFNEQGVGHLFAYHRIGMPHKSYLYSAAKWEYT